MAQATNAFADESTGIQRGRGGFYRGHNDTPYVSDPTGELVKTGPRKGQPKRTPYGSPSGFGKQIENTYNLQKWGERREALGFGLAAAAGDFTLLTMAFELTRLDVDSDEYKELADRIVVAAKDIAETNLSADRGTHAHALAEDDDEGRDWIARAEAGELLGIPVDAQRTLVQAWRDMLERDGLEVLITEASCIDDSWRLAGTLDNVARCGKDLRFAKPGGEIVTIPAGTVLVLDKKTGQRRTDRQGVIQYWLGYAIQVASYAQSRPYDTETEQRGDWPWQIDQNHALIAHLDVLGAINGQPSCELVYVDLVAGREHGGATVVAAKSWEKRTDVFSIAQIVTEQAAPSTPADGDAHPSPSAPIAADGAGPEPGHGDVAPPSAASHLDGGADSGLVVAPPPSTTTEAEPELATPPSRTRGADGATSSASTIDTPPTPSAVSTPPEQTLPPAPAAVPSPLRQAQLDRRAIDDAADRKRYEGDELTGPDWDPTWALLEERFKQQTRPQLNWTGQLVKDAREAGHPFNVGGGKTARRFELYRAVIHLAAQPWANDDQRDATVHELVHCATDMPVDGRPLGAVIGGLNAAQAKTFADLAVLFTVDTDLAATAA